MTVMAICEFMNIHSDAVELSALAAVARPDVSLSPATRTGAVSETLAGRSNIPIVKYFYSPVAGVSARQVHCTAFGSCNLLQAMHPDEPRLLRLRKAFANRGLTAMVRRGRDCFALMERIVAEFEPDINS